MDTLLVGLDGYNPKYSPGEADTRKLKFLIKMMHEQRLAQTSGGYKNIRRADAIRIMQQCGYIRYIH
jgi:hypothetical protein